MFSNKLKYLIIFILLSNCTIDKKKNNEIDRGKNNSTPKIINSYFNILMDNDTIYNSIENGKIVYSLILSDTLRIKKNDKRHIYLALKIKPKNGNKNQTRKDSIYEKTLNISPFILNDTVIIPFSIKPNFKGKATITGVINDNYALHAYTPKGNVRIISYDLNFKKGVFVKQDTIP